MSPSQRILEIISPMSSVTLHSSFDTQQQQQQPRHRQHRQQEDENNQHCVQHSQAPILDSISFPYNCLPWYFKQQVVFQINEIRRRLQFLLNDKHLQQTSTILPSAIPREHRGSFHINFQSAGGLRLGAPHGSIRRMPGNLPKQSDKDHHRYRHIHERIPVIVRDPSRMLLCSQAVNEKGKGKENLCLSSKASTKSCMGSTPRYLKRRNLLQECSGRRKNFAMPPSKPPNKDWYIRETRIVTRPAYCSMEMISFDKESECFHRTEIAYPFQPCVSSTMGKDTVTLAPQRRLARTLQVQTAAVNNVYKHSYIWQ